MLVCYVSVRVLCDVLCVVAWFVVALVCVCVFLCVFAFKSGSSILLVIYCVMLYGFGGCALFCNCVCVLIHMCVCYVCGLLWDVV